MEAAAAGTAVALEQQVVGQMVVEVDQLAINMLQNSAGTSRRAAFYNRLIYNILQYSISSYDNGRPDK